MQVQFCNERDIFQTFGGDMNAWILTEKWRHFPYVAPFFNDKKKWRSPWVTIERFYMTPRPAYRCPKKNESAAMIASQINPVERC